jgi:hypothetical protein
MDFLTKKVQGSGRYEKQETRKPTGHSTLVQKSRIWYIKAGYTAARLGALLRGILKSELYAA